MPRILATVLLLAFALPCHAQQKPNTLTPKEIADGWILLFDGETTFGWRHGLLNPNGRLEVSNGVLQTQFVFSLTTRAAFPEFELHADYQGQAVSGPKIALGLRSARNSSTYFQRDLGDVEAWTSVVLHVKPGMIDMRIPKAREYVSKLLDKNALPAHIFFYPPPRGMQLRNVKLHPLNMKPLFNGKDLTGWNIFPNKKSKFNVKDGAIHLKDGPGDLQTLSKYKDFILQLECKSNGKHLNSGIFFRCRDNEYQNGYEAQIRNEFTAKPTQKYLIEEYDPKTHKLIGKKEQFFTAVDWGTGAIYRRQPARKAMSKDGEWFTMTIVAHGNHFATWVNGVQVTDWTDNRPKSDNARKGCCLNAGHISIQGHDPTTDLSFRNIRIAELK
ncbi:MAG: DUF1080 domain-containing protein [Planctomycetes bacterium]|nr:DUF1080 domain-containing protein [Planctomycetota bacterium]